MDSRLPDLSHVPLGHSIPAHRVLGWCSHCPDRSLAQEVAAWQLDAQARHKEADAATPAEDRPLSELITSGLWWLINRTTFHPRGLALALRVDEGEVVGWQLIPADPGEPFAYPADVDSGGFQRAEATMRAALDVGER
ncbi:hypothetical protein ACFWH1_18420 [Streptomyces sp. NPDC127037]|uniref:hypothetical protein n=1 Tax=Streptomyces sp. NPDC127037 TaxID=3347113 RepID=UPI00365BF9B1